MGGSYLIHKALFKMKPIRKKHRNKYYHSETTPNYDLTIYKNHPEVTRINLPLGKQAYNKDKLAFTYPFLTLEQCNSTIEQAEITGFQQIKSGKKSVSKSKNSKNNSQFYARYNFRVTMTSEALAKEWFDKIKHVLPQQWSEDTVNGRKSYELVGLNEFFRVYRYDPGHYFQPHQDGDFKRPNGEKSFITMIVYLNDGFEGGETSFFDFEEKQRTPVVPECGKCLLFQHNIVHEGSLMCRGRKYAVRTDVMYKPRGGGLLK